MVDVCKSQRNIFTHPRLANLLHLKSKQLHSGVKRQPSHSGPEMNSTPTKEEGITGLMTQGGLEKCQGKICSFIKMVKGMLIVLLMVVKR